MSRAHGCEVVLLRRAFTEGVALQGYLVRWRAPSLGPERLPWSPDRIPEAGAPAGPRESKRPGPADSPGRGSSWFPAGPMARTERRSAALAAEAIGAVDRLPAGGSEGDLGLAAAGRARGAEHLARAA